jgi:hypothetical protein
VEANMTGPRDTQRTEVTARRLCRNWRVSLF